ncbi:MAG: histidinol-phosphate transaminase [Candidatus Lokiarchaeota archaeon]|nr:histidinol-phosphate transaminase [Candidatus Lokiarchaeota archaeon]
MSFQSRRWMGLISDIAKRTSIYRTTITESLGIQDYLDLSANENLFIDLVSLRKLMFETVDSYDPRKYQSDIYTLRSKLASMNCTDADQILLGNGSDQLIELFVRSVLSQDDHAIVVTPTFSMYKRVLQFHGCNFSQVSLNQDFSLNIDSILNSIRPETKIVFLCSPNNPTGNQQSIDDVEILLQESDCLVLLDEAYLIDNPRTSPLLSTYSNLVILRTLSKSFGLAGLRVGYAIGDRSLMTILRERVQQPFPLSTFSVEVALALLDNLELVIDADNQMRRERSRTFDSLQSLSGVLPFPSETNFLLFSARNNSTEIQQQLMRSGILVRDIGTVLQYSNCLRVTIAPSNLMVRFLDALKEVLK